MKLAHSAPTAERAPQSYAAHVGGVITGAERAALELASFIADPSRRKRFVQVVVDAATFHDLGKLDPDTQVLLAKGRSERLHWDHVDAGVAHLMSQGAGSAAWLVRAHHAPGLPSQPKHFARDDSSARRLRGRRRDDALLQEHDEQIARTDTTLTDLLAAHRTEMGDREIQRGKTEHGLFLRLALSCLVNGDHSDSAFYETGRTPPSPPPCRWNERLTKLDAYVARLNTGAGRHADRAAFYKACRKGSVEPAMATCEGPVGIGKTTAVMAWLLRRAIHAKARRIIIVAPYTTILSQTGDRLRRAMILDGENPDEIIAEHHHRADFCSLEARDLAVLWRAPIVLTTSVQFFETLSACQPWHLRKLHALPGSVVCLDEAHAALPAPLWRQNWAWMRELASDWGCSFVFASGSLSRVWEKEDIVGTPTPLPDLVPRELQSTLSTREHARVRFRTMQRLSGPDDIVNAIRSVSGPRLVVLNTVQSAAVIASRLWESGDTLHLSTALCPDDRVPILAEVSRRLESGSNYPEDWTLVATSLVEAGVDLSFRTAFRERFSTSSLIQIGGRVNRHGGSGRGEVIDFFFDSGAFETDRTLTRHPGARRSAEVLARLFSQGAFESAFDPADLVTQALCDEVRDQSGTVGDPLYKAETKREYPEVAELGRLITTDTRLVVVKPELRDRLKANERVSARALLGGSVQIWADKTAHFGLQHLQGRPDVYWWPHEYNPEFLGYMAGALGFVTGSAFMF